MKKTETKFYCDDCGKLLPENFVRKEGKDGPEFRLKEYNTVRRPYGIQTDSADLLIHIGVEVEIPYGPTYKELCPECRLKWLRSALPEFERLAQQYAEGLIDNRKRENTNT